MVNTKDTAIVLYDQHFARELIQRRGYDVYSHLKKTNPFTRRLLNFIRRNMVFHNYERFFFDDKINSKEYKNIIVYDARASVEYLKWLRENHPYSRIILFFDNPISNTEVNIKLLNRNICECWSFDFKDCEKYKMNYNSEFYFNEFKCEKKKIKYDVMFLGLDKGRYKKLIDLENFFKKNGFSFYLHIVPDSKLFSSKKRHYRARVSYPKLLELVSESKVVLDIIQDNQTGLTLRNMEAIFNNKKQITDNKFIRRYNFYSENNVFILGEDDISKINEFINSDPINYPQDVVNYYTFDEWIKRFDL